jgi:hypothetical protein
MFRPKWLSPDCVAEKHKNKYSGFETGPVSIPPVKKGWPTRTAFSDGPSGRCLPTFFTPGWKHGIFPNTTIFLCLIEH